MSAKGKLRILENGFALYCPGCNEYHRIDNTWQFNGNYDRPTFNPSIKVTGGDANGETVCHSFVTDGQWRFLADSTHGLRGQTVDLRSEEISPIEFSETVRQRAKAMLLLSGGYPNRYTRVLYAIVQSGLMLQLIEDGSTRIGGCMNAEIEIQAVLKEACISDDATATRFLDCADGILRDWDRELRAINAEHEKQLQVFREKIL